MRRSSACSCARSVRSRSNVFSTLSEMRSDSDARGRVDRSRVPGRAGPAPRCREAARRSSTSSSTARRADRLDACGEQALLRLRPDAGEPAHVERREERRLLTAGTTTVSPPGLRASLAIFETTFDGETPSAHVRLVAARTAVWTASATLRASRKSCATSPKSRYPSSSPVLSTVGNDSRARSSRRGCEYSR